MKEWNITENLTIRFNYNFKHWSTNAAHIEVENRTITLGIAVLCISLELDIKLKDKAE